jgi:hypothetical protein
MIESSKISMNFVPILQFYRIYIKRLDLLEKFICVYNNYAMHSVCIEIFYGFLILPLNN